MSFFAGKPFAGTAYAKPAAADPAQEIQRLLNSYSNNWVQLEKGIQEVKAKQEQAQQVGRARGLRMPHVPEVEQEVAQCCTRAARPQLGGPDLSTLPLIPASHPHLSGVPQTCSGGVRCQAAAAACGGGARHQRSSVRQGAAGPAGAAGALGAAGRPLSCAVPFGKSHCFQHASIVVHAARPEGHSMHHAPAPTCPPNTAPPTHTDTGGP